MAKISSYPILSDPTISDILIGTDVEDLNITKNFSIGSIIDIVGDQFVPYVGAIGNVNLGAFNITSSAFIVPGGLSSQFLKANGTLDSTVYVPAARTLTINSVTYDLSANRSWNLNTIDTLTTLGTSGAATYIGKTLNIPQYQAQGNYITQLSGEATAVGPGNATVTLSNLAVISKILTGLNITGGTLTDTDSILTAFGKVQNQINGLAGGVTYQGTWNAATNTPTLTSSVGTKGYYYVVSVPGNTNLNGITDWKLGDWAIFNGSIWEKVDNTDAVVSVNGYTGAVVLTFSDVGAPPATRTLSINGTTFDLTANRSWTVGDVRTDQTYSNPIWISSLAWGKITGTPTTLAGYGITDGALNSTTLTINGVTFDISANRTWNVGTVTSIATSGPITGGPITGSGTIGITQAGVSTDGYLSSTDWNTFNNKQNALTNPVTGTGTIYTLPMWSGPTSLVNSPLSYGPDNFNFQYNSTTGSSVTFTNSGLTTYAYTIQMNNFGSPRSTVHSYTDGVVVQSIGGTQVSRLFANGNFILGDGAVDNGYKLAVEGNVYIETIANATFDTDKFIVSDDGVIKYRTGTQILSDIGAQGALTLTTLGSSGPSTLVGNTLNIPDYGSVLTGYVPYTGANQTVNLNTQQLQAGHAIFTTSGSTDTLTINHTSGSGTGIIVTKSGSGEGLTVVKSSGSGNAASITGGITLLTTLNLTNALEDAYIASSSNWNTAYNNRITSLTTTGTSGAATLVSHVLNIPQYQAQGNYITSLTGEATASGPGAASVTLTNSSVTGKVLTGLTVTGSSISSTDSILTAFGKLQGQVNDLIGGLRYEGTWNASTNTPTITSGVGNDGDFYIVSVAGTTNIDGINDWQIGDWIVFHDTAWQKVDNTESVVSVNGFTGAVNLTTSNITEGTNLYFTDARSRTSISLTTTGNSGAATYNNGTGVFNIPQYTLGGLGGVPNSRQLTINGVGYDLSSDRSWTVGDVRTDSSYSNPSWITSLDWAKITGTPTTLSGYGITNAYTQAQVDSLLTGYVTLATDQTITGLKTIVRGGDVLNFKIGTDTLYGLKVAYNQNELVPSGEATWSFVNTFNRNGSGYSVTPLSFFRGVLVTGERLLSASVNANLLDYYGNNPSGRYPVYAYNTGVQQFSDRILVGFNTGVVNAASGAIANLPAGVVANFNGRVIGSNAVNSNEFVTLNQIAGIGTGTVTSVSFTLGTSGTDLSSSVVNSTTTPAITLNVPTASASNRGVLSTADWTTFNNKQNTISLTTTGTSGVATLVGATLNIPQYQAAGTYLTSVTASSPLFSSGGATPNITIQQASGSQNGFLSSSDWTTFNNKANANGSNASGTWGISITGNATYALNSTRLYASDPPYTYGGSSPYYMYMNYDGGSYWELKVSPATPGAVRVAYANSAGSAASASSVPWSGVTSKPSYLMYYQGFTLDANTMDTNATGFTYSVNAPYTGPIARFSANSGYDLWLNAPYGGDGYGLAFRTRNGDSGTFNSWRYPAVYNVNVNGGGALYATIYYDQNNTAYYLDPADADVSAVLRGTVTIGGGTGGNYDEGLRIIDSGGFSVVVFGASGNSGAGRFQFVKSNSDTFQLRNAAGSNIWEAVQSGSTYFYTDVRSPIFYDSNDTGFYVDPNSYSRLSRVAVGGGANDASGININGDAAITSSNFFYFGHSNGSLGSWQTRTFASGGRQIWNTNGFEVNRDGYGGGWTFSINSSGNTTASVDMRAPIFYDSNNTGYFVDAASISNLNQVNLQGFLRRNTSAAGYLEGNYGISTSGNSSAAIYTIGGSYQPGTESLGNMYGIGYTVGNGSSNPGLGMGGWGLYVASGGTSRIFLDSDNGVGISTNSWRAPIFYDSNNTSFYVDPASTSILNGLTIGGRTALNTAYYLYHSNRDFASGTLVQTNIDYSVTNGDPFILEITGNSYGALIPFDIQVQGYIYANTIINSAGISNGTNISGLRAINFNGNLCFWWPRQSYWQGFNVKVYSAYATYPENRVTSITDSGQPTTSKQYDFAIYQSFHTGNISLFSSYDVTFNRAYSNTDMRAPIFYDSNNTGYYLNPNGGSYFAGSLELANGYFLSNGIGGAMYMTTVSGSFGGYLRTSGHMVLDQINTGYNVYVLDGNSVGVVKNAGSQSWSAFSDGTIKTVHSVMENNLSKLESISPIYYSFNNFDDDKNRIGLIAQEVQEYFPELVEIEPKTEKLVLDYTGLIPVLLGAIKELKKEIDTLKAN